MAAAQTGRRASGIFWINGASDEEQPMAFAPGSGREKRLQAHFRCGTGSSSSASERRIESKRFRSTKAPPSKGGVTQAELQCGPPRHYTAGRELLYPNATRAMDYTSATCNVPQKISESKTTKSQASLKDLCPEDKQRIANLIEELARVSEEKEESVQRLRDEQETFERNIQQLEQRNLLIIQERGSLQQQYRECQELLGLYQQYLSQQQQKLNQSISQLHSEVSGSRKVTSREDHSTSGGSYPSPSRMQRRAGEGKADRDRASFSTITPPDSSSSDCEHVPVQGRGEKRRVQGGGRPGGSHNLDSSQRRKPHKTDEDPCVQNGNQRSRLPNEETLGAGPQAALIAPLLGDEDWEEKRHRLLLQKMQLEAERERLQVRLAEQEERLVRQSQQLSPPRIDRGRFQQTGSIVGNGTSQTEGPSNSHGHPSRHDAAETRAVERLPQTPAGSLQNGAATHEISQPSRRNMATLPVKSPAVLYKPASPPVIPRTPEQRLDSPLTELLEIFSCSSVSERYRPPYPMGSMPQHMALKPALGGPPTARRVPPPPREPFLQNSLQDLEESQLLEEIFFIC